ncbi:MAG: tRNA lysidine(34) synthetase TilS [Desulfopila sp.]
MQRLVYRIVGKIKSERLFSAGATVIAAVSGGSDSTALLHVLASSQLQLDLIAVYIDHGLRPVEAAAERAFTREIAQSLGIRHLTVSVDVLELRRKRGYSLEEAARRLRYQALERIRREHHGQVIAVGHTADDQVEEFLIRVIRGTGLKGLGGMAARNDRIVRPLLGETRATLVDYLQNNGLRHCHDSSNEDPSLLRNRIRLELLPELKHHYNPAIDTTILQTTAILSAEEDLLDSLAETSYSRLCTAKGAATPPGAIHCRRQRFIASHPAIQRRVIEKICWRMGARPSFRQILQVQQLICTGVSGNRLHLTQGLRCVIEESQVIFTYPQGRQRIRGEASPPQTPQRTIESAGTYPFIELNRQLTIAFAEPVDPVSLPAHTLAMANDTIAWPLLVRPPQPGETMRPLGAPGKKKIVRIYSDMKIPASQRRFYPVVVSDGEVVAILGLRIAERVKITREGRAVLLHWAESNTGRKEG